MNTRTTLIVAIVAVVVAAYLFLVAKPWEERQAVPEPTTTAKALFDLKSEDIDRVEVAVRGSRHPQRVFEKQDDTWMMVEPISCPATDWEVKSIVDKVTGVKYLKEYPTGNEDRPRDSVSGLTKPVAIVKLFKGDKVAAELALGSRLPTGKGNYIRRGGADTIYETQEDLSSAFTKRLSSYRDKGVLKADLKEVTQVEVTGVAGFKLVKSGDDWVIERPARGRADKARADRVARQFTTLRAEEWVEDEPASYRPYGLDAPRLKVTMETAKTIPAKAEPGDPDTKPADTQPSTETTTHVLLVGGAADDNSYFARIKSAPWVFSVTEYTLKELSPDLSELREKSLAKIDSAKVIKVVSRTPDGIMTLAKRDGKWGFADGAQCDSAMVEDLIKAVRELKAVDFVDPDRLVVATDWDNPRGRITVTQEGQANPTTILVGPASPSGKMVYVRNAAEEATVVVREDDAAQLLAGPVSYRDRKVMTFPQGRAKRIEIARAGADPVVLAKTNHKWSLVGPVEAAADADAVRNLLQDLSSLRAKRVAAAGDKARFGLDSPAVTLAVHLQPLTAEPDAKVVGEPKTETQPGEEAAATQPADGPATRPAKDLANMSPEETQKEIAKLESLLQYQREHPDEEKPELTKIIKDELALLRAATQPSQGSDSATTRPAGTASTDTPSANRPAETRPAAPPPAPTIYRLLLSRQDGKTYACRADGKSDMVYELDSKVYEDAVAEMHDRQIVKFEVDDVIEVAFRTDERDLTFRKSDEDWTYAADPVLPIDKEKVTEALNDFRDLKTHRYVAYATTDLSKYELDKQVNRVAVVPEGGERIEILVSKSGPAEDPDNSRYAVLAGSKKVFLLKGDQAGKCLRKLEDFEKAK